MRAQYYRRRGYLVFKLDNRGSARRGLAFEAAIRHDMGNAEVADQAAGVAWLVSEGLTDPARVGIYGWSYGGYLSAMALMKASDVFAAAVAGAPVTSWDGYDSHYTERYMGRGGRGAGLASSILFTSILFVFRYTRNPSLGRYFVLQFFFWGVVFFSSRHLF